MVNLPKRDLVDLLSTIDGVVFVGGTSEYLQGIKDDFRDIDIVAPTTTNFDDYGFVFKRTDPNCFLSSDRGVIRTKDCYIDIFYRNDTIDTIEIDGYKCQPIKDMIIIQKKIIAHDHIQDDRQRLKVTSTINRLINSL